MERGRSSAFLPLCEENGAFFASVSGQALPLCFQPCGLIFACHQTSRLQKTAERSRLPFPRKVLLWLVSACVKFNNEVFMFCDHFQSNCTRICLIQVTYSALIPSKSLYESDALVLLLIPWSPHPPRHRAELNATRCDEHGDHPQCSSP